MASKSAFVLYNITDVHAGQKGEVNQKKCWTSDPSIGDPWSQSYISRSPVFGYANFTNLGCNESKFKKAILDRRHWRPLVANIYPVLPQFFFWLSHW